MPSMSCQASSNLYNFHKPKATKMRPTKMKFSLLPKSPISGSACRHNPQVHQFPHLQVQVRRTWGHLRRCPHQCRIASKCLVLDPLHRTRCQPQHSNANQIPGHTLFYRMFRLLLQKLLFRSRRLFLLAEKEGSTFRMAWLRLCNLGSMRRRAQVTRQTHTQPWCGERTRKMA